MSQSWRLLRRLFFTLVKVTSHRLKERWATCSLSRLATVLRGHRYQWNRPYAQHQKRIQIQFCNWSAEVQEVSAVGCWNMLHPMNTGQQMGSRLPVQLNKSACLSILLRISTTILLLFVVDYFNSSEAKNCPPWLLLWTRTKWQWTELFHNC